MGYPALGPPGVLLQSFPLAPDNSVDINPGKFHLLWVPVSLHDIGTYVLTCGVSREELVSYGKDIPAFQNS